jgi:proteic killer suppression protein
MLVTTTIPMIHSFKHRGLKRLYENGDRSRINPLQIDKIELILADLDAAETILHLRRPGYRLHELKGQLAGRYAIDVSGNWRLVFRFQAGRAYELDLMDYH